MVNWFLARTIVEEKRVQRAVDEYSKQFARFDEAFDALKWLLARKAGEIRGRKREVDGTIYHLYRQASDRLAKTPDITVLYKINDDEVEIIGIKAREPMPDSE